VEPDVDRGHKGACAEGEFMVRTLRHRVTRAPMGLTGQKTRLNPSFEPIQKLGARVTNFDGTCKPWREESHHHLPLPVQSFLQFAAETRHLRRRAARSGSRPPARLPSAAG